MGQRNAGRDISHVHDHGPRSRGRLRARGVKVEEYDTPGLKTEDGIADIGFRLGRDPTWPGSPFLEVEKVKAPMAACRSS